MSFLVLIPTTVEWATAQPYLDRHRKRLSTAVSIDVCGFGMVAAAARTASLISRDSPAHVLLVGIAGSFDNRLAVGSAWSFESVRCHGIGVGGNPHQSAQQLGWWQWDAGLPGDSDGVDSKRLGDQLPLRPFERARSGMLLSCCAASADTLEADQRRSHYGDVVAEEMEGFGVAMACHLAGVPLTIIRGISNRVGDREHSGWEVEQALNRAAELAVQCLQQLDNELAS